LDNETNKSLYSYLKEEINRYYSLNPKKGLIKKTNFEELLYVMLQLSAVLGDENYRFPMNAFLKLKKLPKINSYSGVKFVDSNYLKQYSNYLKQLCFRLIDKLAIEFRERCKTVLKEKRESFDIFSTFINKLAEDFDVAFITLNYDNLITQACPKLFTGFNETNGSFDASSLYARKDWGLIYHLHGSVHFDMQGEALSMHAIKWNDDLYSEFQGNSIGRNSQDTSEGIDMPTSIIVAGYGKANQIQRLPFRTYYSKIDEISEKADAFLFMGYGFNDLHLNNSFHSIRSGSVKRPVVVIDWADDHQDPMEFRNDEWANNLSETIPVNAKEMATRKYKHTAPDMSELKDNDEFEVSNNPNYPLSIWYSGFMQACRNYEKIKSELETSN
jgi:hypothetical protein